MTALETLFGSDARRGVERAVAEFRSGRPCLICDHDGASLLAAPSEGLDDARLGALSALAGGRAPSLILTGRRAHWLGLLDHEPEAVALDMRAGVDAATVAGLVLGAREPAAMPVAADLRPADAFGRAAVDIARLAHLAPSVVLMALSPARIAEIAPFVVGVTIGEVAAYRASVPSDLMIVSQARVPLRPDVPSRFVVFRGGGSLHDQVAIVVGTPPVDAPVPVRLHSACLTGDLFGSLKCDCGDQLRNTVARFHEIGGGVLLYLDQEGRGIGIANKMRAYRLQETGFDTIDADAQLGFRDDERDYSEAARMLQLLGYSRVALHSNNPRKLEALRRAGLTVVSREPVKTPVTLENARYLKTKAARAGHLIDTAWVDEVEAALVASARATAAE
ncbi:hypothetical protein ABB55_26125 [Prosthecomicrobium hirschii]|uniref:GTP cyclohydrolase-2 n=1 Tax=Prosthecodimorpha hirschii TaxID=665126 RepID=A0A0P6W9M7_9HYPH|nr:GTP cyclohydrolase II RibA [Prosthecomicrobium hirschii]KPL55282.1 hypothetical protein ABB55_26125 [Prosthecomicrobium hirschii]